MAEALGYSINSLLSPMQCHWLIEWKEMFYFLYTFIQGTDRFSAFLASHFSISLHFYELLYPFSSFSLASFLPFLDLFTRLVLNSFLFWRKKPRANPGRIPTPDIWWTMASQAQMSRNSLTPKSKLDCLILLLCLRPLNEYLIQLLSIALSCLSVVFPWRGCSRPDLMNSNRNLEEKRQYFDTLHTQVQVREQGVQQRHKDEQEEQKRHFESWERFWGKPGYGAPRDGRNQKENLMKILHYPELNKVGRTYYLVHSTVVERTDNVTTIQFGAMTCPICHLHMRVIVSNVDTSLDRNKSTPTSHQSEIAAFNSAQSWEMTKWNLGELTKVDSSVWQKEKEVLLRAYFPFCRRTNIYRVLCLQFHLVQCHHQRDQSIIIYFSPSSSSFSNEESFLPGAIILKLLWMWVSSERKERTDRK